MDERLVQRFRLLELDADTLLHLLDEVHHRAALPSSDEAVSRQAVMDFPRHILRSFLGVRVTRFPSNKGGAPLRHRW